MNLNERIEKLEAELAEVKKALGDEVERLAKLKESAPKKFELWRPRAGELFYMPCPIRNTFTDYDNVGSWTETNSNVRGLAFQSEADAAEVGKYLAVIGKRLNILKQFPDQDFRLFMTKEELELYDQVIQKLT